MQLLNNLFENWGIKLISLCLALTLWFYVTSKGRTEVTLTVPMELRNIPAGMVVVGDVPGFLEVRVQGRERVLRDSASSKKVIGILDLSTTTAGQNAVHLSPDDIRRPAGVNITHISPSEVQLKLEPLLRRTFRLRPVLRGSPGPGHRVSGTSLTPQKITVEGPASAVSALDGLKTMPVDIQDATESFTVDPKIDYRGHPVKLLDKNIALRITIERVSK
jgi:YbbR domain-containing protein